MTSDATAVRQELDGFIRSKFNVAGDDPNFGNDVHLFDHGYLDSFSAQELIEIGRASCRERVYGLV